MPRVRLGVALLLPPDAAAEIDGLRRGLGDGALARIPAHLTLVPPVNVREDDLGAALDVVRAAAAASRPLKLELGPPATFLPTNPVLYLEVGGDVEAVGTLRDAVFRPPLERPLTWPFVPHVTIADEAEPDRIAAAIAALGDYRLEVRIDHVHVLQEGPGRVWEPIAAAALEAPAVIGRGGLPVELAASSAPPDADVQRLMQAEWNLHNAGLRLEGRNQLTVTARRDGALLGVAQGWTSPPVAFLQGLIVVAAHRGEGVGSHLLARFESVAAERGCHRILLETFAGTDADAWYRRLGWHEVARIPEWNAARDNVYLQRNL